MPLIGTLSSGSLGPIGLTQQAQIAILKATTAIPGSVPVSADWTNATLAHTLDNPNAYGTSADDLFGAGVAISGDYAIVSARYEDDAGGTSSGKAYIYNVSTGALVHTLDNPNAYGTSGGDEFGFMKVAISGDHAIVGAWKEDDAGGTTSGKAYIFNLSDGSLAHTLDNPNPFGTSANDQFGMKVAISGDYAIVSARGEDDAGGTSSGKAYIFNVSDGSLVYTLDNPSAYGTSSGDYFGVEVAISGDHAIVGAYLEDEVGSTNSGKAYIFDLSDGSLAYTLDNPNAYDTPGNDYFGWSVAISDTHAIVGAYQERDADGWGDWDDSSGKAYIFNLSDGSLAYTLDNPNPVGNSRGDRFGFSVDVSDTHAIVGAYGEDDASRTYSADEENDLFSGKAYIFDLSDGSLVSTLDNPTSNADDQFGYSVAISGGFAIIGTPKDDVGGTDSGKAYIFSAPVSAPVSSGWSVDLSNITYDNVSFDVSSQANHLALGQSFNNDGTKMYIIAIERQSSSNYARNMFQYTLSTGFDISTASYDNVSFIDLSEELYFFDVKFNNDGTKMYMIGTSSESIYQYTLSTGFDISTASYDNVSFSVESEDVSPMRIIFKNDGTKMYILGGNSDTVYQYTLSTSFDISTASYDSVNFYVGSTPSLGPNEGYAIDLSSDGTKLYRVGLETSDVYQYTLSTPFDLSTASYDSVTFNVDSYEGTITDVTFSGDGTKMYILGDNKTTYQYSTGL